MGGRVVMRNRESCCVALGRLELCSQADLELSQLFALASLDFGHYWVFFYPGQFHLWPQRRQLVFSVIPQAEQNSHPWDVLYLPL